MDVDYQPLPDIWKGSSPSPTSPGPVASSSKKIAPTSSIPSRRIVPSVIIPPRPLPASPVVAATPVKKGKTVAKAKGSDVLKTIPVEEVPASSLLTVPELEGLQDAVDLSAVSKLFFFFFYFLNFNTP